MIEDNRPPDFESPVPQFPEPPVIDLTQPQPVGFAGMLSWEGVIVRVMQLMGVIDAQLITPDLALTRIDAGLKAAHDQVTMRAEVITNQANVLNAFAALLKLPEGSLYSDMVPLVQALIEKSAEAPTQ